MEALPRRRRNFKGKTINVSQQNSFKYSSLTERRTNNTSLYYSTVVSVYRRISSREPAKHASVTLHNPCLTGFSLKEDTEAKTKSSGIINLLFGVLVDNTRRHFIYSYATRKIWARIIMIIIIIIIINNNNNNNNNNNRGMCKLMTKVHPPSI